jgi:hypothetical protein
MRKLVERLAVGKLFMENEFDGLEQFVQVTSGISSQIPEIVIVL